MCFRKSRRGFTLIEMIVVISIIVLAMLLAIPAIRSLTGSRSVEAAENTVSAAIGAARAQAIALQRTAGVLFYLDVASDRVGCIIVQAAPFEPTEDAPGIPYLDAVDGFDPILLPAGTRIWTMRDQTPSLNSNLPKYIEGRYQGFNVEDTSAKAPDPSINVIPGGVILFDGSGRLTTQVYGFRNWIQPYTDGAGVFHPGHPSALGAMVFGANSTPQSWPFAPKSSGKTAYWMPSSIGLVIFDKETFLSVGNDGQPASEWNAPAEQVGVEKWLDVNTTPVFVNRYSGNLMRAE